MYINHGFYHICEVILCVFHSFVQLGFVKAILEERKQTQRCEALLEFFYKPQGIHLGSGDSHGHVCQLMGISKEFSVNRRA